jgi:hypothetical protein
MFTSVHGVAWRESIPELACLLYLQDCLEDAKLTLAISLQKRGGIIKITKS